VAWVKNELELSPPPPPPDTQTWPPTQQRPPNPLAPQEPPKPAPVEATAAVEPSTPEPPPEEAEAPAEEPKGTDKTGGAVAKAGQGTSKTGTSKPKGQTSYAAAKEEPAKKPGETSAPTGGTVAQPSGKPKDLKEALAKEGNSTVELNPDGQAEVVDTRSPSAMRKAGIGLLTLVTVPPAAVYDGATSLGTTPLIKLPLQVGTYRLRILDPEGNSRLFSAPVELAKEKKYTIRLSDLPAYGE
jgi:serine/threonine-protein kinase